jgi:hypothetical protein
VSSLCLISLWYCVLLRLLSSHLAIIVLTLNKFLLAISLSFTGSPIHPPPSRCSQRGRDGHTSRGNGRDEYIMSLGSKDARVQGERASWRCTSMRVSRASDKWGAATGCPTPRVTSRRNTRCAKHGREAAPGSGPRARVGTRAAESP